MCACVQGNTTSFNPTESERGHRVLFFFYTLFFTFVFSPRFCMYVVTNITTYVCGPRFPISIKLMYIYVSTTWYIDAYVTSLGIRSLDDMNLHNVCIYMSYIEEDN